MYVLTLDIAVFLFVPPAPSSTTNKSASAKPAPISVAPSISKSAIAKLPSAKVSVPLIERFPETVKLSATLSSEV